MPLAAAWPALRDAYLQWLAGHEAGGAVFEAAEQRIDTACGELRLRGSIDRIDRLPDGTQLLIDYKTESQDKTAKRVQAGGALHLVERELDVRREAGGRGDEGQGRGHARNSRRVGGTARAVTERAAW